MTSHAYPRFPDVHGDLIAFTAADDVWLAPLGGGQAWRITDDGAPVQRPRISPDGRHVAYTSELSQQREAYVVDVDDGAPRRLTFWGNRLTRVTGWTADGRVIVTSGAGANLPTLDAFLYAITIGGADAGRIEPLPFGRASEVAIAEDGTTAVSTVWRNDVSHWKHYRGGTAAKLWLATASERDADPAQRQWRRLLPGVLEDVTCPMFLGDRLAFASDTAGEDTGPTARATSNLWSVDRDGGDLTRHTSLRSEDGYLRDPATDGTTIVFHSRGRLFRLDGLGAEPREIDVRLGGIAAGRRRRAADPDRALIALRPVPDGRASVVEWRGSAHVLTHRGGPSRLLAAGDGVRIREAHPLGATGRAVYVSDAGADRTSLNADSLRTRVLDGSAAEEVLATGEFGRILHVRPSPEGRKVAFVSEDGRVRLVTTGLAADPGAGSGGAGAGSDRPAEPRTGSAAEGTGGEPQQTVSTGSGGVAAGTVTEIGHGRGGEVTDLAWSPDARWVTWREPDGDFLSRLMLADTTAEEVTGVPITSGTYDDASPVFSRDGKYLAFVAGRTFETAYDDLVFDLAFINSHRPFLVPLTREILDPFGPSVDGWGFDETDDAAGSGKDAAGATEADVAGEHAPTTDPEAGERTGQTDDQNAGPKARQKREPGTSGGEQVPEVRIDLDGFEQRAIPFPVPSGYFSHLTPVDGGFVWVRQFPEGELGATRAGTTEESRKPILERWDVAKRSVETLVEGVSAVEATGDGKRLVAKEEDKWVLLPADRKVEADDPARVEIDLDRLHLEVDPVAERRGMLWDNYRIMAQQFWRPDMDGQDWAAIVSWYDPAVDRVVTADDFADLLWEVVGELGTSHAYVMPPHGHDGTDERPGFLGIDTARDGEHWVIARILRTETSDLSARSPLEAAGVDARVGDRIIAVNGRDVDPSAGVAPLLIGTADHPVELVLERDGTRRRTVVVPLAQENDLRYQNWVARCRAYVTEHSGGRLGYLHVPDMVSTGWAQMHRDLREASRREGIVVDVRYNRGGHTSQLVIDRLARRVVSWGYQRNGAPETYPDFAPRGPVVLVTNAEAGSDGDIINAVAQAMGVGTVIGTRTWGGVIGIDGRFDLVDGTGVTQPKYASWFEGVGFGIENYGVDPDIEVERTPADWVADREPQLDRAIAEALEQLAVKPAATPPEFEPPRFA